MDMREASAMTEVSGLTPDQEGVENAVGATPGTAKDMSGNPGPLDSDSAHAAMRFSDQLRKLTLEAPLQSLLIAFLLGVLVARRR
jgi:hypothetical protein